MDIANATLSISCNVECPNCKEYFDLFEQEGLTDDGYIYKELLPPNEMWGKDNWGEIVRCPECEEKITIDLVEW